MFMLGHGFFVLLLLSTQFTQVNSSWWSPFGLLKKAGQAIGIVPSPSPPPAPKPAPAADGPAAGGGVGGAAAPGPSSHNETHTTNQDTSVNSSNSNNAQSNNNIVIPRNTALTPTAIFINGILIALYQLTTNQ